MAPKAPMDFDLDRILDGLDERMEKAFGHLGDRVDFLDGLVGKEKETLEEIVKEINETSSKIMERRKHTIAKWSIASIVFVFIFIVLGMFWISDSDQITIEKPPAVEQQQNKSKRL